MKKYHEYYNVEGDENPVATSPLPKGFDWEYYLHIHPDLQMAGMKTKEDAEAHYLRHGCLEGRYYKPLACRVADFDEITVDEREMIEFLNVDRPEIDSKEEVPEIQQNGKKVIFTICAANYLAQAKTLGDSIANSGLDYRYIIFLIDSEPEGVDHEVIEIGDIYIPHVHEMAEEYDIVEYSTAVKPFCFRHLFDVEKADHVIFLDPDIMVFSKFTELEAMAETHDVLLTPHMMRPVHDGLKPREQDILNAGIYNLGFIYLKNTPNTHRLLDWWSARLQKLCKSNVADGNFVDQLWANFFSLFFERVGIIRHAGYNMAYWNLHERALSEVDGEYCVNDSERLVFFHFSGYHFSSYISIHQNRYEFSNRRDLLSIFSLYKRRVLENNYRGFNKITPVLSLPSDGMNLFAYVNQFFGNGITGNNIRLALNKTKMNHNTIELFSNLRPCLGKANTTKIASYQTNIICTQPDISFNLIEKRYLENKRNIGVWFWETEVLPESWTENYRYFSEVWAASDFLYDMYIKQLPSEITVKRVNLPVVAPKLLDQDECKAALELPSDCFLCLFAFDWNSSVQRKNPMGTVDAFKQAFNGNTKARLIIKSINGANYDTAVLDEVIGDDPRIMHITDTLDKKDMNILMNAIDVYISLHRSEGLGQTLQEAILLEKPTLCTRYSGNVDFCLPQWSELVEYSLIPVSTDTLYDRPVGHWAEPNIDDAVSKLKYIYNNIDEYCDKAKVGRKWILENYNINRFKMEAFDAPRTD